jgi:hypothetical protein
LLNDPKTRGMARDIEVQDSFTALATRTSAS